MEATREISRQDLLLYRLGVQQLPRVLNADGAVDSMAILDIGVQESRSDGARWAMVNRGWDPGPLSDPSPRRDLVTLWTVRGAPHVYRRAQVDEVLSAVAPVSPEDAEKRIFDASRPLRAAGVDGLTALNIVAEAMRAVVTEPMVKGDVSSRVAELLPDEYKRFCRPCNTVHLYEMTFRLGATQAGLELEPGTSPPILRPIERLGVAAMNPALTTQSLQLIRGYLHFFGPATVKQVATYLDMPIVVLKKLWPQDVVDLSVEGEPRSMLADDLAVFDNLPVVPGQGLLRLLAPFDLFLQMRDRELLVPDPVQRKALWRTLGRPGAILVGGNIVGTWRPRAAGKKFSVESDWWFPAKKAWVSGFDEQVSQLATVRGMTVQA